MNTFAWSSASPEELVACGIMAPAGRTTGKYLEKGFRRLIRRS